ncbi:PopZ family protein [Aureimonas fodinaquatilis]|nr:DUF2497 domain-containing protein [Aureimonas fodinaquatilis]
MKKSSSSAEPSMEEILASIRQIIEQGEAGRTVQSASKEKTSPEIADETPASAPARPVPVFSSPVYVTPARSAYSGSVAFDLRHELEDDEAVAAAGIVESAVNDGAAEAAVAQNVDVAEEDVFDIQAALQAEFSHDIEPEPTGHYLPTEPDDSEETLMPDFPAAPPSAMAANNDEPRMRDFRSAILEEAAGQGVPAFRYDPLISDETESQISASFAELTQAIRSGELRSLEEMAQDILRPMMKEWLDENLPDVVAEIVREEIRRAVLRGR